MKYKIGKNFSGNLKENVVSRAGRKVDMSLNRIRLWIYHKFGCLPHSPVKLLLQCYLPPVSLRVFFNYCGLNLSLAVGLR